MYKYYSWEALQQINNAIDLIEEGSSELSSLIIYGFAPTLWIDFLNSDPQDDESMWHVYRGFITSIERLKDWIVKEGHTYSKEIREMKPLSKDEFLDQYHAKLRTDAEKLHSGMREIIDNGRVDMVLAVVREIRDRTRRTKKQRQEHDAVEEIITKGAAIPPLFFTMVTELYEENGKYSRRLQLHTPAVNHPSFWLSIIHEGMLISSCWNGKIIARRCAAPDCRKYFIPHPRNRSQMYHSRTCRNRHRKREWRASHILPE